MRAIVAFISLPALLWIGTAHAQSDLPPATHSVSVSVHRDVQPRPSEQDVDAILEQASKLLQKDLGHIDKPDDVACPVTFKRSGPIRTFVSPDTDAWDNVNEGNIQAVHSVDFDVTDVSFHVKIVNKIGFCKGDGTKLYNGCSWPHQWRSIIVVAPGKHPADRPGQFLRSFADHALWAHEFGHLTGLWHRDDAGALMIPCQVQFSSVRVNRMECSCLLGGPGSCRLPEFNPTCR